MTDRPTLIRRAVVEMVAEHGLAGASMSSIAARAGVATGTAYVHYESKDDLLLAAHAEAKRTLAGAVVPGGGERRPEARDLFVDIWLDAHRFLREHVEIARFLVQMDSSPLARHAHRSSMDVEDGDPASISGLWRSTLARHMIDLPPEVLYDLTLGIAVRLAADPPDGLTDDHLPVIANACWRAVARP